MVQISVEIVHLDAMRVASSYGFGDNPEQTSWKKMVEWAKPKGLLNDLVNHPIFGFNNPYPTPESPRYGYEFWIKVDSGVEPEGDIRIVEFFGGTYVVARCQALGNPGKNIPESWQCLAKWCKDNNRQAGRQPALEKFLTSPDDPMNLVMDLYCPIE